jgi:hypothetical protein
VRSSPLLIIPRPSAQLLFPSNHPCPTCCTSRVVPKKLCISTGLYNSWVPQAHGFVFVPHLKRENLDSATYLGQVNIGNDNAVQCTWSVLGWVSWVTSWVILVLEILSSSVTLGASCLPWHAARSNVHPGLRGCGCGLATYFTQSIRAPPRV